jgi:hypothetical protein
MSPEQARIIERVRKLVQLAASEAENEARSAAVKACRLILEHGLEICDRVEKEAKAPEPHRGSVRGRRPPAPSVEPDVSGIVSKAAGQVVTSVLRKVLR